MAYILPPITQVSLPDQNPLSRFRRALRRDDQRVLDDLLDIVQERLSSAARDLPFEMLLLFALLAEGSEVLRLWQQIDPYSDSAQEAALRLFPAHIPQDG